MMIVRLGTKLHIGKAEVVDGVFCSGGDGKKYKTNQPQISSSLQLALRGWWDEGRGQRLSCSVCVYVCQSLCLRFNACIVLSLGSTPAASCTNLIVFYSCDVCVLYWLAGYVS